MPELPEVESVRRRLAPAMVGARFARVLVHRPDLRTDFPARFAARLTGQSVVALERRAKYLLATLSSGETLLMHLGMSGSFRVEPMAAARAHRSSATKHDHVEFEMSSGMRVIFNDPRRFGVMDLLEPEERSRHPSLAALGPEPLSDAFDAGALARACRGKRTSLKAALLDQRVVAGLGNIYVSEALHLARLSPGRLASTIATPTGAPRETAKRLTSAIKRVLTRAVTRLSAPGERVRYRDPAERFRVYDRLGARCMNAGCRGSIHQRTQAGRSTFFCPSCQR